MKTYQILVTQFYKPIIVRAEDENEAITKAREDKVWQPWDVEIKAEVLKDG